MSSSVVPHNGDSSPPEKLKRYGRYASICLLCTLLFLNLLLVGLIVNVAPFHQIAEIWTAIIIILLMVIVVYALLWLRVEHVKRFTKDAAFVMAGVLITFIAMLVLLGFLFPESFNGTRDIRVIKMGSVSATTATFFVRNNRESNQSVYYRKAGDVVWEQEWFLMNPDRDFTGFKRVFGLTPNTTYEWKIDQTAVHSFATFPLAGSAHRFNFYFGSCFLYNFPNFMAAPGWKLVNNLLTARSPVPAFIAFIGDIIYSDHPYFDPSTLKPYTSLYRQTLSNPHIQPAMQNYPGFFMYDDHEQYDNYDSGQLSWLYNASIPTWNSYFGNGNLKNNGEDVEYFDFDVGDSAFFVTDSRSFRDKNKAPASPSKTMLGSLQKQRLKTWLLAKNTTSVFKFIMVTVGITRDLRKNDDSWGGGFVNERDEILNYIRVNQIGGVVFLTGDSHFVYLAEIYYAGSNIFEISSSPTNAFPSGSGGFGSSNPWNDNITENVLYAYKGVKSAAVSLLAIMEVDTTAIRPHFNLTFYEAETPRFTRTFYASDIVPR